MPTRSLGFFLLACLLQCRLSYEARILLTTGTNFGSHFSVFSTVGHALVDRGHTVTALISDAYAEKANDPRLEHLQIEAFHDSNGEATRTYSDAFTKHLMDKKSSGFTRFFKWMPPNLYSSIESCKDMINHFENKEHHYDLVLLDGHSSCSVFLASRLAIPYVLLIPSGIKPSLARRHGIPDTTSYYPEMSTGLSYRMTFSQRVSNTVSGIIADIAIFFEYDALSFLLSMRYNITKSVRNLVSNAQLILINSDFSVDYPFPLYPNVVTVGGLTTRPKQPLSEVSGMIFNTPNLISTCPHWTSEFSQFYCNCIFLISFPVAFRQLNYYSNDFSSKLNLSFFNHLIHHLLEIIVWILQWHIT